MESTQIQELNEPPPAAMPQLSEKPRQGFETWKTAGKPGSSSCNFTVALGLRATVVENGVRETYSARYYNPATGRFLSRDPEDGIATDPKTLHKYLYAGGDPANAIDPSGRADAGETGLTFALLSTAPVPELTAIVGTAASNALLATGITDAIAAIEAAANAGSAEEAVEILINATKLIIKTKPLVRVFLCSPLVFAYGFAEGQLILYAHAHGFNDLEVKGMEYVLDKGKDALKVACGAQLLRYFKK